MQLTVDVQVLAHVRRAADIGIMQARVAILADAVQVLGLNPQSF